MKNVLSYTVLLAFFFIQHPGGVLAQTANQISISISGIEYDDPSFASFRETVKKNPKVRLLKPSYNNGTATLTFNYPGDATQLWEELPKNSKINFKVSSIGEDRINLDYIKAKKAIDNTPTVTNKKDCFNCDYFPMCNFDVTKSYSGRIFHGTKNDDNSVEYYYCENGEVIKRWDYTNKVTRQQFTSGTWDDYVTTYEDYENKTASLTILKSNVPVGTSWIEQPTTNGTQYKFTIAAKGIKLIHDGKTYNDVIKVEVWTYLPTGSNSHSYHYYAKNAGYLGKNFVDEEMKKLEALREATCARWCGIWKEIEHNGKLLSPNDEIVYLELKSKTEANMYRLLKKNDGNVIMVRPPTFMHWVASPEQPELSIGIEHDPAYGPNVTWPVYLPLDKRSVPGKTLYIGTRVYQYVEGQSKPYEKLYYKNDPETVKQTLNSGATISITYKNPNRDIARFGTQVQNAGGQEVTSFETDKDLNIQGKVLPKGKYGLYMTVNGATWTMIFNKLWYAWEAGRYTDKDDILRIEVLAEKVDEFGDAFKYSISKEGKVTMLCGTNVVTFLVN